MIKLKKFDFKKLKFKKSKTNTKTTEKTEKSKKRKKFKLNKGVVKFIKIFSIVFCVLITICILLLIAAITGLIDTTANLDLESYQLNLTSHIYYIDPETGEEVEYVDLYDSENRQWADIENIPQHMKDAIISIEDERFYKHNGVDFLSTGKAMFQHLFKTGSRGGSTITQQLVKNLTKDNEVTVSRKVTEILRALNLERKWTKSQILEMYLNTIYLSNGVNGVAAGADYYFGKDISEVTIAEAALLAGITQYPSKYDPVYNFKNSKEKQEVVLSKMLKLGKITQKEYDDAIKEELKIYSGNASSQDTSVCSYFTDMVIDDVIDDLMKEKGYSEAAATALLYNGGLKIYATIDPEVQTVIETYYNNPDNFPQRNQEVPPQSALLILDPKNGEIKGVAGGIGEKKERRTLNRATQAYRQPGSSFKPIAVYAPAIEKGVINPNTQMLDAPITIGNWSPKNDSNSYYGMVTMSTAVARSLNSIAVQVLQETGVEYSYDFLTEKLGITSLVESRKESHGYVSDKNLSSLALGGLTDGISLKEIAAAYAPFANNGLYNEPHSYTKVLDNNNKIVLEYNKDNEHKAMSANTAYSMVTLLRGPVQFGTGTAANFRSDMDICGKTGTTDDNHDRWFVGFTPYYVAASWYGYDTPKAVTGVSGNPAIPGWKHVMSTIHQDLPGKKFEEPKGYKLSTPPAQYCTESNCLANAGCIAAGTAENGIPTSNEICTLHGSIKVDTSTGMLATENCPAENIKTIYYHSNNITGGRIETSDGSFTNGYCTAHGGNGSEGIAPLPGNENSGNSEDNSSEGISDAPVIVY